MKNDVGEVGSLRGRVATVATWYFLFSLSSSQILKLKSLIGIKFKKYVTLSVEKRGIISTSRLGNLDRHYSWNRDFNGAITWILTSFTTNIAQATISLDQSTFPRLAYQMSLRSTCFSFIYTHAHDSGSEISQFLRHHNWKGVLITDSLLRDFQCQIVKQKLTHN